MELGFQIRPKKKFLNPSSQLGRQDRETGLGLSLAYDIVRAHGGDITFHTEKGEGTEFIISIPI